MGKVLSSDGKVDPIKVVIGASGAILMAAIWPVTAAGVVIIPRVVTPEVKAGINRSTDFVSRNLKDSGQFFTGLVSERQTKRQKAVEERRAKDLNVAALQMRIERIQKAMEAEVTKASDQQRYFDLIVAMFAVGMACAASDGEVSAEEREDLKMGIAGNMFSMLPVAVRQKLDRLTERPPSVSEAYAISRDLTPDATDLLSGIIDLIVHSDGIVHPKEVEFCDQWHALISQPAPIMV
jgi:hypothetical protein